jgi:CRISPR-associated protein Cmr4
MISGTTAAPVYLHAITPIHSGTGSSADIVDLPIAREKATGWPVIPGSSLKGVLAGEYEKRTDKAHREAVFGNQEWQSKLAFTDMRILCLPVRSFAGTFAWVTSPLVLERYARDAAALGASCPHELELLSDVFGSADALAAVGSALVVDNHIILEDLDLSSEQTAVVGLAAESLAKCVFGEGGSTEFVSRFAIVSNDIFDYLCETATEVVARIKLGEDGNTSGKGGNLWYEEAVPAEAIFAGFVLGDISGADAPVSTCTIQVGGHAGVGRGLCSLVVNR